MRCPNQATTLDNGADDPSLCICLREFFDSRPRGVAGSPTCEPCRVGTLCPDLGTTRTNLRIDVGHWRLSAESLDVRRCPDAAIGCRASVCNETRSGCRGSDDTDALCAPGLTGPFCRLCVVNTSRPRRTRIVYKAATPSHRASCEPCGVVVGVTLGAYIGTLAALLVLSLRLRHWLRHYSSRRTRELIRTFWKASSPVTKLKIILGFYFISLRIESGYEAELPSSVRSVLTQATRVFSVGLSDSTAVLTCMGVDGHHARLVFWTLIPAMLVGLLFVATIGRLLIVQLNPLARPSSKNDRSISSPTSRSTPSNSSSRSADTAPTAPGERSTLSARAISSRWRRWLRQAPPSVVILRSLPWTTRILFFFYPFVTNAAFESFSCYRIDERRFLVVDVSIECDATQGKYAAVLATAWLSIGVYAIGQIVLFAALLGCARRTIHLDFSTPLSNAIAFLHREFRPTFFWWEIVEMIRRLVLVGAFVAAPWRGTISQLIAGCGYCLIHMLVQLQAQPYRSAADNFLANLTNFALALLFLCLIVFQLGTLTEVPLVYRIMSDEQRIDFTTDNLLFTYVLLGAVVTCLVLSLVLLGVQLRTEGERQRAHAQLARLRRLRHIVNLREVKAPTVSEDGFHLFLSHVLAALIRTPSYGGPFAPLIPVLSQYSPPHWPCSIYFVPRRIPPRSYVTRIECRCGPPVRTRCV